MIEQTVRLMGFVPKSGEGVLDNGTKWVTDRIEIHVMMPLDTTKGGQGHAGQMIKLEGHDKWLPLVTPHVGSDIILESAVFSDGKGGNQSIKCVGFRPTSPVKKSA